MSISREQLLKVLTVKTEVFELESLKFLGLEDSEVTLKELTMSETKEYNKIKENKTLDEALLYACRCSMIEPPFFTDEELKVLNKEAQYIINDVSNKIPLIGKSEEEKEKYYKLLEELSKDEIKKEEPTKEVLEKK